MVQRVLGVCSAYQSDPGAALLRIAFCQIKRILHINRFNHFGQGVKVSSRHIHICRILRNGTSLSSFFSVHFEKGE